MYTYTYNNIYKILTILFAQYARYCLDHSRELNTSLKRCHGNVNFLIDFVSDRNCGYLLLFHENVHCFIHTMPIRMVLRVQYCTPAKERVFSLQNRL